MPSSWAVAIREQLRAEGTINAPTLHRVRREFSRRLRGESVAVVLALADELMEVGSGADRFLACALVRHHPAAFAAVTSATLERLGAGMDSWGDVDMFATLLAGQAWREGRVSDDVIHGWARSRDRWWRRAALASTVPLNIPAQGGHGDTPRTLAVCRLLVDDRDDMVVKALSWALRALAPRDPEAVSRFLDEHADALAARVKREVRSKLDTGLKNPPRRSARL